MFYHLCNVSFKEHLPEDGHNRWPKHVAGHAVYYYNKFTYSSADKSLARPTTSCFLFDV